jgi:Domain of unknown function (DUF222)
MNVMEIDDMSGGELLDHVESLAATQRRCEVEILKAAVQHAYLNDRGSIDSAAAGEPGRERVRRIGGSGTPEVAEFAAAELAGRLAMSTISAGLLMADGLDVCHRLPLLWRRVEAGEVRVHLARLVARRTRELSVEQAAYVDARVAQYADGRLTWTRFQALVDGVVAAADPDAIAERERRAAEHQFARPTNAEDNTHGIRGFYIRAPFGTVAIFDAALDRMARVLADLGDPDPVDRRRVKALLILARPDLAAKLVERYRVWRDRPADPADAPHTDTEALDPDVPGCSQDGPGSGDKPEVDWSAVLPAVTVYVHLYRGVDDPAGGPGGIGRVEGCGPVTEAWVRDDLSPQARATVRPVLDLEGLAPVDAYEIPQRHRRAVQLMTPADTFPFSSRLHPDQIDHTIAYRHGPHAVGAGQSRLGNYAPMTTFHHRIKTFGRWTVKQPFPGIYVWRDPHGQHYLVDHTGTRPIAGVA